MQLAADTEERERLVQKALEKRLKELKLEAKHSSPKDGPPEESPPEESPDWIYHSGNHQYSCAAEEEGAHL